MSNQKAAERLILKRSTAFNCQRWNYSIRRRMRQYFSCCLFNKKDALASVFSCNRQRPILPARLQTSTFGVRVLNYCVRHGNRWNHTAIITGYSVMRVCTLKTIQKKFKHFRKVKLLRNFA